VLGQRGFARRTDPSRYLLPHTYTSLIGLLVSTGLRISEALRLDLDDAHLDENPPHLVARQTKFRKSRLVPLHPSTTEGLQNYIRERRELGHDGFTPAVFVSERGRRLSHDSVCRTWGLLLRRTGLGPTADGRPPTVHAMRHTFAVRRLVEWQRQGIDVAVRVPHLSVYMRHAA
jgi:integrase/recombinase XerD